MPDQYTDSKIVFLANTHPAVHTGMLDHFPNRELVVADTMNSRSTSHGTISALLQRIDGRPQRFGGLPAHRTQQSGRVAAAICDMGPPSS